MFSKDFYYGASTAGFQVEMGSGKAIDRNTDWYVWTRDKLNARNGIVSGDNPEDGCDYWLNYKAFHDLAAEAGMNMLRIGVEWSRIFPEATFDCETPEDLKKAADMDAIAHYKEIMKDITDRGMKLMVNLNHFTLPLWLHDPLKVNRNKDLSAAGWVDERSVKEFAKYARFVVSEMDELVDFWSTQNEPNVVAMPYNNCGMGFPPTIIAPDLGEKAIEHEALAHIKAYDAIKKISDKPVGCIYAFTWPDGEDSIREEVIEQDFSRYMNKVAKHIDFLGVNYYSRTMFGRDKDGEITGLGGYGQGCEPNSFSKGSRVTSDFGWEVYPEGLYNVLKVLARRFKVPMFITENGIADAEDRYRPYYLISHMNMIERLVEEGIDIRGYLHWSLVDNFEWAVGFSQRFGLVHVNYETKQLTPRSSFYVLKKIIESKTTHDMEDFLSFPHQIFDKENLI